MRKHVHPKGAWPSCQAHRVTELAARLPYAQALTAQAHERHFTSGADDKGEHVLLCCGHPALVHLS